MLEVRDRTGRGKRARGFPALVLAGALAFGACSRAPEPPAESAPIAAAPALPAAPASYEGYYDVTNCNGIMAWAWDTSRPDAMLKVDIYDGSVKIATMDASDYREDLKANGKGNGKHSFSFTTPASIKDGKPHKIVLRFAGTSQELSNGPRDLTCKP